jgi:hypothetical protein
MVIIDSFIYRNVRLKFQMEDFIALQQWQNLGGISRATALVQMIRDASAHR